MILAHGRPWYSQWPWFHRLMDFWGSGPSPRRLHLQISVRLYFSPRDPTHEDRTKHGLHWVMLRRRWWKARNSFWKKKTPKDIHHVWSIWETEVWFSVGDCHLWTAVTCHRSLWCPSSTTGAQAPTDEFTPIASWFHALFIRWHFHTFCCRSRLPSISYMRILLHIHIYIYIHTYTYIYIHIYIHIYIYIYIYTYTHNSIYIYIHNIYIPIILHCCMIIYLTTSQFADTNPIFSLKPRSFPAAMATCCPWWPWSRRPSASAGSRRSSGASPRDGQMLGPRDFGLLSHKKWGLFP